MGAGGSTQTSVEVTPAQKKAAMGSSSHFLRGSGTHDLSPERHHSPGHNGTSPSKLSNRGDEDIPTTNATCTDKETAGCLWEYQDSGVTELHSGWHEFDDANGDRLESAFAVDGKEDCSIVMNGRIVKVSFADWTFNAAHLTQSQRVRRVDPATLRRRSTFFFEDPFGGSSTRDGVTTSDLDLDQHRVGTGPETLNVTSHLSMSGTAGDRHHPSSVHSTDHVELVSSIRPHDEAIYTMSVSVDGTQTLTGSKDGTMRLWEASTGYVVREFHEHPGQIISVSLCQTKPLAASGCDDSVVRLFSTSSTEPVAELEGHEHKVYSTLFTCDGRHLISAAMDGEVRQWDVHRGVCARTVTAHNKAIFAAAAGPQSPWLVLTASDDATCRIHDLRLPSTVVGTLRGHKKTLWGVDIRKDEREVATCGMDDCLLIWDLRSLPNDDSDFSRMIHRTAEGTTPNNRGAVNAMSPSQSQSQDALAGSSRFSAHDSPATSPRSRRSSQVSLGHSSTSWQNVSNHHTAIHWVEYMPDGRSILSSARDKLWKLTDLSTGQPLATGIGHKGNVFRVHFNSLTNRVYTCSSDRTVKVWQLTGLDDFTGNMDG